MADEITLTVSLPTDNITLTISDVASGGVSDWVPGEVPDGIKNEINKVYAIDNSTVGNSASVQLGQTIMRPGIDYTLVGPVLTMITYAPTATEYFAISYFKV